MNGNVFLNLFAAVAVKRSRTLAYLALAGVGWLAADLFAAPAALPKETRQEGLERQNLVSIHRSMVEVFVDRPGFGFRRMIRPYTDVITAPKPPMSNDQGSFDKEASQPKVDKEKNPGKDKDAHFTFQDLIGERMQGIPIDENEQWILKKVQLVGLTKNPTPIVYDTAEVPGMKGMKEIPTRELDAFEKKALEALQSGDNLSVERKGASMRAMGPIYAGKQCLACHDKPGEMLGAFTYSFERVPVKKPKTP